MIGLSHVTRSLGGRAVLRDVSLSLAPGEGLALHGPNGAGKTTVWRLLAGLLRPERGSVTWDGKPVAADDWPVVKARIGVLGHEAMAQPALSPFENLAFFAAVHGLDDPRRRACEWLSRVGLGGVMHRPLGSLSRGQRQRYAIARAFQHAPSAVLLDEPFAGLDREGAELLAELLAEHHARGGASLVIDHDEERAARVASRALALRAGRLVPTGEGGP